MKEKNQFWNLTLIAETFQICYLDDPKTDNYFLNLINKNDADYTRYIFFYLSFLAQNNNIDMLRQISSNIEYKNSTLLLSKVKHWEEQQNSEKFQKVL